MFAFLRKHRAATAIVALVLLTGAWYLFRPEKLFINQRVNEAAPFAQAGSDPQPVFTGRLSSGAHETSGRATVYKQPDGSLLLRLTDFKTSNGPDVHVVLAASGDPGLKASVPGSSLSSVEVGALKGNEGDQGYTLPASVDLAHYNMVAIYCVRFHVVFGSAQLQAF